MSRLGKLPIEIKEGVQVKLENGFIVVKGKKGELKTKLHPSVNVKIENNQILVDVKNKEDKSGRAIWGLFRSLIENSVIGVTDGFEKTLEINGVGYRAQAANGKITLTIGYSHPVIMQMPAGIEVKVEENKIIVSGADKQLVGEMAAQIRKVREPEPYNGKGIKYADEIILRKAGKSAGKSE